VLALRGPPATRGTAIAEMVTPMLLPSMVALRKAWLLLRVAEPADSVVRQPGDLGSLSSRSIRPGEWREKLPPGAIGEGQELQDQGIARRRGLLGMAVCAKPTRIGPSLETRKSKLRSDEWRATIRDP